MEQKKRPIRRAESIQSALDDLFERTVSSTRWITRVHIHHQHAWKPPTDVFEAQEEIVVKVEIPGMREDDFQVVYADDILTISGVRMAPESSPQRIYQQMEICYGDFISQVYVPWAIDADGIKAHYEAGFLTITLPRLNRASRRVPVHVVKEEKSHNQEE
jgi:HSP20 family protein